MRIISRIIVLAAPAALLGLTGCGGPKESAEPMLMSFASCDEMEDYIQDVAVESINAYGWWPTGWWWGGGGRGCFDCVDDLAAAEGGDGGGASSYSETNTQEAGVDEADFVKNDDQYIYVLSGQELLITDAWPAEELHQVSRTPIEGWPQDMYLSGDTLVVFSSTWETAAPSSGESVSIDPAWGLTKVSQFDVSDRAAPQLMRELYVDGYLYDSRRIGNKLHLVVYHPLRGPEQPEWQPVYEMNPELWKSALRSAVRGSTLADWVPLKSDIIKGDDGAWAKSEGWAVECTDVHRPNRSQGLGLVSVQTLDLAGPANNSATAVVSQVGQVYSSPENMYIAEAVWMDRSWWRDEGEMATRLHRFDLSSDPDRPTYTSSGQVPGWLLNQFSMSEHEGHLRVATTEGWWGPETTNNVFVLEEQTRGNRIILDQVGSVRDIAPGETIFAVRFVGPKGYVVTFERIDPLFTMDLSDPANPRILGELEITGFSNYLHPLGDDHLIGIGEEADTQGQIIGMQVSLFDVSDMSDPQLADRDVIVTGWSWSEAQWDHHAFNYFGEYEALAVPVVHYDDRGNWNWERVFTGLNVYRVNETVGVELIGQLDQSSLAAELEELDPWMDAWCSQVRRSVFMEDRLYAVSAGGVVVADLDDLTTPVNSLAFDDWGGCYTYYW